MTSSGTERRDEEAGVFRSPPALTIGLPVFNAEAFVREALDDVLAQSFGDFTLLISDNASTDRTQEICEEYAQRDRRIRYIRQDTNLGAVRNFNALVEMAATPLFMWHAADDRAYPGYVEACVTRLAEAPDAVLAYGEAELIDPQGKPLPYTPHPRDTGSSAVTRRFAACLEPFHNSEIPLYGVVRTEILRRTRLLGVFGGSDRALAAELSLHGPFIRIPEVLFRRRVIHSKATEAEIQEYNTGSARTLSLREWKILWSNLGSIRRAPLAWEERRELYATVMRRFVTRRDLYVWELKELVKWAAGLER